MIPFGFKITVEYRSKSRKKVRKGRREGYAFVIPFGLKITLDYWSKSKREEEMKSFECLWHLGGAGRTLKPTLEIGIIHGGLLSYFLSKIHDFLGQNGIKISIDYRLKEWENCSIL